MAKIDQSVTFVPFNGKSTLIGKRVRISSGAVVYGGVSIGNDSFIGHNTIVKQNTKIGTHSVVGHLCVLEGNLTIGEHSLVHANCHISQRATIGNYVFIAPMCGMMNDPKMVYYREGYSLQTGSHWNLPFIGGPTVEDGARIGAGTMLFPGVHVGKNAVVGIGSLVIKDVPDYTIVFGRPAQERGHVDPEKDSIVRCPVDHS